MIAPLPFLVALRDVLRERIVEADGAPLDQHHDARRGRDGLGERGQIEDGVRRHRLAIRLHLAQAVRAPEDDAVVTPHDHDRSRHASAGDGILDRRVDPVGHRRPLRGCGVGASVGGGGGGRGFGGRRRRSSPGHRSRRRGRRTGAARPSAHHEPEEPDHGRAPCARAPGESHQRMDRAREVLAAVMPGILLPCARARQAFAITASTASRSSPRAAPCSVCACCTSTTRAFRSTHRCPCCVAPGSQRRRSAPPVSLSRRPHKTSPPKPPLRPHKTSPPSPLSAGGEREQRPRAAPRHTLRQPHPPLCS